METLSTLSPASQVALITLASSACRVEKRGDSLRFRFRRADLMQAAEVQALVDAGLQVKFYTGGQIHTAVDGTWSFRSTGKIRAHAVVEVAL